MWKLYQELSNAEDSLKLGLPLYFKKLVLLVKDENKKEILTQISSLMEDPKTDIMDLFFYRRKFRATKLLFVEIELIHAACIFFNLVPLVSYKASFFLSVS
jgi:hypothetical protein